MTRRDKVRFGPALLLLTLSLCLPLMTGGTAWAQGVGRTDVTAVPGVPLAEEALPGIVCARPRDGSGYYTGTARCPVRSSAWTYFQAYLTYFDDCSQTSLTTSTIRMQVLARRGGTGVHIGGVWVVFVQGSRRFGSMQFHAIDGANRLRDGAWNYYGGWSSDIADLYSNGADPIRYGVTTTNFVGMTTTTSADPYFRGQFAMSNYPSPNLRAECRMNPLSVVFTK